MVSVSGVSCDQDRLRAGATDLPTAAPSSRYRVTHMCSVAASNRCSPSTSHQSHSRPSPHDGTTKRRSAGPTRPRCQASADTNLSGITQRRTNLI